MTENKENKEELKDSKTWEKPTEEQLKEHEQNILKTKKYCKIVEKNLNNYCPYDKKNFDESKQSKVFNLCIESINGIKKESKVSKLIKFKIN